MKMKQGVMWRLIVCVSLLCCSSEAQVTCRNENGAAVDWFIMYKVPKVNSFTGLEYLYIDSTGAPVTENVKPINHHAGVLANTLAPMFGPTTQMPPNFGFISYSDQPPPDKSAGPSYGHSKGVVMMDRSTGVWLLHSTPRFPFSREANNFYPTTGETNAQTFICVTFKYDQFKKIGKHLKHIKMFRFDHHNMDKFPQGLGDVLLNEDPMSQDQTDPTDLIQTLKSAGGRTFLSVAKKVSERRAEGDLYVTIANELQSPVYVQTWGGQACREDSYCQQPGQEVLNIDSVKTELGDWGNGKDHSKWCVTKDQNRKVTCIADSNRARSQFKRPGGALCIKDDNNVKVWDMFNGFIATIEDCPVNGDRGKIVPPPP